MAPSGRCRRPRFAGQVQRPLRALARAEWRSKNDGPRSRAGACAPVLVVSKRISSRDPGCSCDHHIELKREGIEVARGRRVGQPHAQLGVGVLDHGELRVAREAVLRHGADGAVFVAPEVVFAVDEMARDEGEEDRISAAHLEDLAPVGVVGPADDLAPVVLPAQDARAVIGRRRGCGSRRRRVRRTGWFWKRTGSFMLG